MKKTLYTLSLWTALSALASAATTYNLTDDKGTGHTNPFGASDMWTFLSATHTSNGYVHGTWEQNPSNYTRIGNLDWNATANREMWYVNSGDVWSIPAVRTSNYTDPSTRAVQLCISNGADAIVAWTSQGNDTITVSGSLSDDVKTGSGALMWISLYTGTGADTNILKTVSVATGGVTTFSFTTTVQTGDVLYFRKTYDYQPDNYGTWASTFDVSITVPEPACLGVLGLAALGLASRRRK